jgi:hypothetical protein
VQNRNKLFVLNYIGEPDERAIDGAGEEYFIYTRPICRYAVGYKPDKEIKVAFRRGMVIQVIHRAPN